jgi:hypothetical protein
MPQIKPEGKGESQIIVLVYVDRQDWCQEHKLSTSRCFWQIIHVRMALQIAINMLEKV